MVEGKFKSAEPYWRLHPRNCPDDPLSIDRLYHGAGILDSYDAVAAAIGSAVFSDKLRPRVQASPALAGDGATLFLPSSQTSGEDEHL
ncbi:MAG: hypothetical protein ACI841_000035 [Planctomycetota bacterium]|jgi:hypothetical protein